MELPLRAGISVLTINTHPRFDRDENLTFDTFKYGIGEFGKMVAVLSSPDRMVMLHLRSFQLT